MLVGYISKRILKLSIVVCLVLSFSVFFTQLLRFIDILSSLPLKESVLLNTAWFFYLFIYFFPNAFLISFIYVFFELKESKKLSVIESFGMNKTKLMLRVLIWLFPIVFACFFSGFFINREDIQFLRKYSIYKYYSSLLASIPEKTFYKLSDMSIYVHEREGDKAKDVFFSSKDMIIYAKRVTFKEGKLVFEKGSVLYQQEGKSFVASFEQNVLNLQKIVGLSKKKKQEDTILHITNFSLLLLCIPVLSYLSIRYIHSNVYIYYFLTVISLIYQLALILVRNIV